MGIDEGDEEEDEEDEGMQMLAGFSPPIQVLAFVVLTTIVLRVPVRPVLKCHSVNRPFSSDWTPRFLDFYETQERFCRERGRTRTERSRRNAPAMGRCRYTKNA